MRIPDFCLLVITFTSECTILITIVILILTSQCMPFSGLTSFHSIQLQKIAPRMHQNSLFELKNRKIFWAGVTSSPHTTPTALDTRNEGARPPISNRNRPPLSEFHKVGPQTQNYLTQKRHKISNLACTINSCYTVLSSASDHLTLTLTQTIIVAKSHSAFCKLRRLRHCARRRPAVDSERKIRISNDRIINGQKRRLTLSLQ